MPWCCFIGLVTTFVGVMFISYAGYPNDPFADISTDEKNEVIVGVGLVVFGLATMLFC